MARPQVLVRPGLNVWRLLRTDRDEATEKDIPRTAAAAVRYFLGEGVSPEPGVADLVPTGRNEWRFGAARPVQVVSVSREAGQAMPDAQVEADRLKMPLDLVPAVRAKRPWWVLVSIWWRGPTKSIDYPGVVAGWLWPRWELSGADWLLDRAVSGLPEAEQSDPGSATWAEALGDKAQSAFLAATDVDLGKLLVTGGQGLAIAALLYVVLSRRHRG